MTELVRVGDIEVPQDLRHERRAGRLQHAAGAGMLLVLLLAVLGLFGRGIFSAASATAPGGAVAVEYERTLRQQAPAELHVELDGGSGGTQVAIARSYLEAFQVQQITPEPERQQALPDRLVFAFDQEPPSEVTFALQPQEVGLQRATVWGPGERPATFRQLVFP